MGLGLGLGLRLGLDGAEHVAELGHACRRAKHTVHAEQAQARVRASARTPAARLQPHAHYIMPMPVRVSRLQRAARPAHVCEYMNAEAPLSKAHG